jgi:large subunit ribosomal protein L30
MAEKLEITLIKSTIGYPVRQKVTARTLGLRKLHQKVIHQDTPQIRGMIQSIKHLVKTIET